MIVRSCIFNLDGVVVDTSKYHYKAWRRLANELGFDLSENQHRELKGLGRAQSMEQILTWGGVYLTEAEKLHWADVKNNWYLSLLTQMKPDEVLDGVLPTLRKLRKMGIKIGLSSGSRNAARVVSCLQLVAFFDAVVDGSAYRKNKPDPACYLVTAANLGVPPQQTLVFEDMPAGIIAALTGGFRVIGVGQREHLSLAHHVISDFINFQPEEYGILPQPINANA